MFRDNGRGFPIYVTAAERKEKAAKALAKQKKKNKDLQPVTIQGRSIATTFWGKAWCTNLESYRDYDYRLERGRSYVRNGAVLDLKISKGEINALVHGSRNYQVKITISTLAKDRWKTLIKECSGKIDSLIELLQGKFSKSVMEIIIQHNTGLFPHPHEIQLSCSCPDEASMCKHVAAALYGVGARFDTSPQDLFLLRSVDHIELITNIKTTTLEKAPTNKTSKTISEDDLSMLFDIDIETTSKKNSGNKVVTAVPKVPKKKTSSKKPTTNTITKRPEKKKNATKKETNTPPPHTEKFKFDVALSAACGKSVAALCKEFGLDASQVTAWKNILTDGGPTLMEKPDAKKTDREKPLAGNLFNNKVKTKRT
jgi:uncharacterized Zn finger protein